MKLFNRLIGQQAGSCHGSVQDPLLQFTSCFRMGNTFTKFPKEIPNTKNIDHLNVKDTESSPFDNLPDELVLRIFQIYIENHRPSLISMLGMKQKKWKELILPHDLLLNTIARVSTRFRRISSDKSLWSGRVVISGQHVKRPRVIHKFLVGSASALEIYLEDGDRMSISNKEISILARKCKNMKTLYRIWRNSITVTFLDGKRDSLYPSISTACFNLN